MDSIKKGKFIIYKDGTVRKETHLGLMDYCPNLNNGYPMLRVDGKLRMFSRVMWESFNGEIPAGNLISYKDGNKKNVSLDNLYLITRNKLSENTIKNTIDKGKIAVHYKRIKCIEANIEFDNIESVYLWLKSVKYIKGKKSTVIHSIYKHVVGSKNKKGKLTDKKVHGYTFIYI